MFVIKESTYDAKSADEAVLLHVEDPTQLIDAFETYEKFHQMENHSVSGLLKKSEHKVCSMNLHRIQRWFLYCIYTEFNFIHFLLNAVGTVPIVESLF